MKSIEPLLNQLTGVLLEKGIGGLPPLSGARELAQQYRENARFTTEEERITALIQWEATKSFTSGFLLGVGGALALPVTFPTSLGASYVLQARLAGAVASLYGHSLEDPRVQTLMLVSLLGDAGKELAKSVGVRCCEAWAMRVVERIPCKVLARINERVGFALLAKSGSHGAVQLTKAAPLVGGLISGVVDAASCKAVGHAARRAFRPPNATA